MDITEKEGNFCKNNNQRDLYIDEKVSKQHGLDGMRSKKIKRTYSILRPSRLEGGWKGKMQSWGSWMK